MAPIHSDSTSIGLTSGRVIPLKNLSFSCKYWTGENPEVQIARGAIVIPRWGKHQGCSTPSCSISSFSTHGGALYFLCSNICSTGIGKNIFAWFTFCKIIVTQSRRVWKHTSLPGARHRSRQSWSTVARTLSLPGKPTQVFALPAENIKLFFKFLTIFELSCLLWARFVTHTLHYCVKHRCFSSPIRFDDFTFVCFCLQVLLTFLAHLPLQVLLPLQVFLPVQVPFSFSYMFTFPSKLACMDSIVSKYFYLLVLIGKAIHKRSSCLSKCSSAFTLQIF